VKHLKVFESFDRPRGDGDSEDVIEALSVFEELFDEFSITRHEALAWMPTSHKYPKNSITYNYKIIGSKYSALLDVNNRLRISIYFTGDKIALRESVEEYVMTYIEKRFESLGFRFSKDASIYTDAQINVGFLHYEIYRPLY